ncbi:heparinase II/III family protein [Pirellulales bacterium]|nr:heparinase II/III family protein [Pirellulales bacterium]
MFDRRFGLLILLTAGAFFTGPAQGSARERPLLLFGSADVPMLRERMKQEPHRRVYDNFKEMLDSHRDPLTGQTEMQIAALVYTINGESAYAQHAKRLLMKQVADWQQGLASPAKGNALGVSRDLRNLCLVFDMIQPSGLFSAAEEETVQAGLALAVTRLMERGTSFNPYDYYLPRFRVDNWTTDRIASVGMFALTFPAHPSSESWLKHALDECRWQLKHALLPDGAWPEGTRYHGAVLRALIPFAWALKRNQDVDLFAEERFRSMFESLVHVQTPRDATLGGAALMPGVGDSNWESIWEAVLGWGAAAYADSDPAFAGRLMWAWERADSPFTLELSPGNPIVGLLLIDTSIGAIPQPALTSEILPESYAVLRDGFDTPRESYLLLNICSARGYWQHHHHDRGSLSLYAANTPLALDPGVQDYGASLSAWHSKSEAHNMVVFNARGARPPVQWAERVRGASAVHSGFDDKLDYVAADLSRTSGAPYRRWVFFVKPSYYLIWDEIDGRHQATYHLHVLADEDRDAEQSSGNAPSPDRLLFSCQNDVTLEVGLLAPPAPLETELVELARDPYPVQFFTERDSLPTMFREQRPQWLKLRQAAAGQDFVTLLNPRRDDSGACQVRRFETVTGDRLGMTNNPAEEESFVIDMEAQGIETTFYLGSQSRDAEVFVGRAAVVRREASTGKRDYYLVHASRLKTEDGLEISLDWPASLVVHPLDSGEGWRLVCDGSAAGRSTGDRHVRLSFAAGHSPGEVAVITNDRGEPLAYERDAQTGAISFQLADGETWLRFKNGEAE